MLRRSSKTLVEDTYKVSIWQIKQCIGNESVIKKEWKDGFVAYFQYINLGTDFEGVGCEYIRIVYKRSNNCGETRALLVKGGCHFGGERFWFKCPSCSKRMATLYSLGNHFACRNCLNLTYYANNASRRYKLYQYRRMILKQHKRAELLKHRLFYGGEPTKYKVAADKLTNVNFDLPSIFRV